MKNIESLNNQEIKNVIKLRKAGERKKQGLFVIEGRHEIFLALEAGIEIKNLFFCPQFISDENFILDLREAVRVSEEVFQKMSLREKPDGCLAVANIKKTGLENYKLTSNPLILVLESLEKPGNIGAILRTADAVKVDAVFVCDAKTDIYNPNVIRASLGTVFTNNIIECTLSEAERWLKKNKIAIYTTTPRAKKSYFDENYPKSLAVLVGTEHDGLSKSALKISDKSIFIPMRGKIDSLNASVSTAVVLYEIIRQRN